MDNHWSRKLSGGIGTELELKAQSIEKLSREKSELIKKLELLNRELSIQEYEILQYIKTEWKIDEIIRARGE